MQLVIADTGPVNYLLLTGHIDILPVLFEKVILPSAVYDELADSNSPSIVRRWISDPPAWVDLRRAAELSHDASLASLGAGERAAIALAIEVHADLVLMDDRRGVTAALQTGLNVTGTLGLLARAAKRKILNLGDAFDSLKRTNFRYRQDITADKTLGQGDIAVLQRRPHRHESTAECFYGRACAGDGQTAIRLGRDIWGTGHTLLVSPLSSSTHWYEEDVGLDT